MIRVSRKVAGGLLVLGVAIGQPGVEQPAASQAPVEQAGPRRTAQVHVVPRAAATISVRPTEGGAIQVDARAGELVFRKRVQRNGTFTVELATPRDVVEVAFAGDLVTVTRAGRQVIVTPENPQALGQAAGLLAGSEALGLTRAVAAVIAETNDVAPASAAVLAVDALIGAITGDVGAPGRVGRHLSAKKRALLKRVEAGGECYAQWESEVLDASYEMDECASDMWWIPGGTNLCGFRWLLQVEASWFHMLACIGFNF